MKSKCVLYLLAVGMISAAPAFADKISVNSAEQDRNSVSIHELLKQNAVKAAPNAGDFGQGALSETSFVSPTNVSDGDGRSVLETLSNPKESKSKDEGHPILLGTTDKTGDKHKPIKHDGDGPPAPAVAVPEPSSFTLVLFGLGTLCILLYRRNSQ